MRNDASAMNEAVWHVWRAFGAVQVWARNGRARLATHERRCDVHVLRSRLRGCASQEAFHPHTHFLQDEPQDGCKVRSDTALGLREMAPVGVFLGPK